MGHSVGTRIANGVCASLDPACEDTLPYQPVVPVTVHVPICCKSEAQLNPQNSMEKVKLKLCKYERKATDEKQKTLEGISSNYKEQTI